MERTTGEKSLECHCNSNKNQTKPKRYALAAKWTKDVNFSTWRISAQAKMNIKIK